VLFQVYVGHCIEGNENKAGDAAPMGLFEGNHLWGIFPESTQLSSSDTFNLIFTLIENDRPSSQIWGVPHLYPFIMTAVISSSAAIGPLFAFRSLPEIRAVGFPGNATFWSYVLWLQDLSPKQHATVMYSVSGCIWMYLLHFLRIF
jgi:hypothetical protein